MPRYIRDAGAYDADTLSLAERLFERFVGCVLAEQSYTETVLIDNCRGRLKNTPVTQILECKARLLDSTFVPWTMTDDIAPGDVREWHGNVVLPPSLFGESYDQATVTYLAGLAEIPQDIENAVASIYRALVDRSLDEWSGVASLDEATQATIAKYRERR